MNINLRPQIPHLLKIYPFPHIICVDRSDLNIEFSITPVLPKIYKQPKNIQCKTRPKHEFQWLLPVTTILVPFESWHF